MKRRRLLRAALVSGVWCLTTAHTPYGQWTVYRRTHLLILTDRSQPGTFEMGQRIAALLAAQLPESRARVTRAPYRERVASLLISGQLDVALLHAAVAEALFRGDPPFTAYGAAPLRTIALGDGLVLVARADFPEQHAYRLAATLADAGEPLPMWLPTVEGLPIPVHAGVVAFLRGRPLPEAEPTSAVAHDHPHVTQEHAGGHRPK